MSNKTIIKTSCTNQKINKMKKFFKIILSLTLFVGLLTSCENEELDTFEEISQITNDKIFRDFVERELNVINQISDIDQVLKLSEKGETLSEIELNELAIALGFKSYEKYENFYIEQKESLEKLDAKYNYSSIKSSELYNQIEKDLRNMEPYKTHIDKLFEIKFIK